MGPSVYVKVVGFRDAERHALNTLFRLSIGRPASYGLWTPEAPVAPQLVLIDLDAEDAGAALDAAGPDSKLQLICIGRGAGTLKAALNVGAALVSAWRHGSTSSPMARTASAARFGAVWLRSSQGMLYSKNP